MDSRAENGMSFHRMLIVVDEVMSELKCHPPALYNTGDYI